MLQLDTNKVPEVEVLNTRLIYLNKLRVDVGKFYVLVVGAVLAASGAFDGLSLATVLRVAGIPFIAMGFAVLFFDIKTHARATAVARGIRERLSKSNPKEGFGLAEDLFFAAVICAMNAFVCIATVTSFVFWNQKFSDMHLLWLVLASAFMLLLMIAQAWIWRIKTQEYSDYADEWSV